MSSFLAHYDRHAGLYVKSIVGLLVNINDTKGFKSFVEDSNIEHKVDVKISLDGITKEFSIEDFKKCLGF